MRPLVKYCRISVGKLHDRHLVLSTFDEPLDTFLLELSNSNLRKLDRWRLIAPLKMVSIVTGGATLAALEIRLRSWRNSVSSELGARVSRMKATSAGDVTSVWMCFKLRPYCRGALGTGLLDVGDIPYPET